MKKQNLIGIVFGVAMAVTACAGNNGNVQRENTEAFAEAANENKNDEENVIQLSSDVTEFESGFSGVEYDGDYGFDDFLAAGGASTDSEVVAFLTSHLLPGVSIGMGTQMFGCSTIAVPTSDGEHLFGRNFDWGACNAMAVLARPENGYASISTVNMDFITRSAGGIMGLAFKLDYIRTMAALYAPLDGMNEAGLAVSVNMISDSATINQNTDKPDITTTTAIRLLLDKAANVEEALELLESYDFHASMGMMIHLVLADSTGRSVVVEYIDNQMVVTETPVVTNFYLSPGEKAGIGSSQSHERYEILINQLEETSTMSMDDVRDALDSVSKDNFGDEFESTEWSIVFNLSDGLVRYYHRENFEKPYVFQVK